MGLDPGTATTGYGIIKLKRRKEKGKIDIELVAYGVILTKANGYMPNRLLEIYKEIGRLLNKHKPDKVALESLFFFKNQKTVMTVSQARGVIMLACAKHKLAVQEYPPLQVKNLLCQNGRADKKEIQETVKKILKMKIIPKPDDAADALAAAICCAHHL